MKSLFYFYTNKESINSVKKTSKEREIESEIDISIYLITITLIIMFHMLYSRENKLKKKSSKSENPEAVVTLGSYEEEEYSGGENDNKEVESTLISIHIYGIFNERYIISYNYCSQYFMY